LRGSTSQGNFQVPPKGRHIEVIEFKNRPYEIRILVQGDFNGTLYLFNFEGIKKLTEGIQAPIIEQIIEGPLLIDFTPNRRGAYMFIIESKVSSTAIGAIGIAEGEAISQDLQQDSLTIGLLGVIIASATLIPKLTRRIKNEKS
jgi:hypothetical protein